MNTMEWGPLPLRIVAGIIFIVAGFGKLTDISGTTGMFSGWGIPLAGVAVWVVALVELLGGIALVLGLWSRWSAIPLGIVMLIAVVVQLGNGFMAAWTPLLGLASMASLFLSGSGRLSTERLVPG